MKSEKGACENKLRELAWDELPRPIASLIASLLEFRRFMPMGNQVREEEEKESSVCCSPGALDHFFVLMLSSFSCRWES